MTDDMEEIPFIIKNTQPLNVDEDIARFLEGIPLTTFPVNYIPTTEPSRPRTIPSPAELWFGGRNWFDGLSPMDYPPTIRCGISSPNLEYIESDSLPIIIILN